MAPSRKFDRYMVGLGAARHVKFRRLSVPERHAFFLGVLSIAAAAPIRGCMLVGDLPAEPADVAQEADVNVKVAESALEKLRQIGMLYRDSDLGCERVHDFDEWNPSPKTDTTAADRQRRYRDKLKASRHGGVTRDVTPTVTRNGDAPLRGSAPAEVEEEEKKEANASSSAVAAEAERPEVIRLCELLAELIIANDPKAAPGHRSKGWRDACRLLLDKDNRSVGEIEAVIRWSQADPFWRSNILSMPKLREKYAQLLLKMQGTNRQAGGSNDPWSTENILAAGRSAA